MVPSPMMNPGNARRNPIAGRVRPSRRNRHCVLAEDRLQAELGVFWRFVEWRRPEVPAYLTIHEAADLLRLGERTIYGMRRAGRLRGAAKARGKWRVDRDKLVAWMEAGGELAGERRATKKHHED